MRQQRRAGARVPHEVDVGPTEVEQLAAPQARVQREQDDRREVIGVSTEGRQGRIPALTSSGSSFLAAIGRTSGRAKPWRRYAPKGDCRLSSGGRIAAPWSPRRPETGGACRRHGASHVRLKPDATGVKTCCGVSTTSEATRAAELIAAAHMSLGYSLAQQPSGAWAGGAVGAICPEGRLSTEFGLPDRGAVVPEETGDRRGMSPPRRVPRPAEAGRHERQDMLRAHSLALLPDCSSSIRLPRHSRRPGGAVAHARRLPGGGALTLAVGKPAPQPWSAPAGTRESRPISRVPGPHMRWHHNCPQCMRRAE
jgi:hypothetical protein